MTAAEITRALGGRWSGSYGSARCPAHEDRTPSLGLWNAVDGRLIVKCFAGCPGALVFATLHRMGLDDGRPKCRSVDPASLERFRVAQATRVAKQSARARALWGDARTVPISGTLGETYLRSRGVTCRLSDTLRFQSAGWHASAHSFPMIVALVEGVPDFAVHRTYLAANGASKAAIEPNKVMLGAVAGGAVRVAEAEGPLVVAEGIETALSLCSGILDRSASVWAALSATGMAKLRLPADPRQLIIAFDGDPVGRTAAQALGERANARGWRVSMLPAPDGRDWNDVLLAGGTAA